MAYKQKPEDVPGEDVCCGAYASEAGCCPFDYYPEPESKDKNTKDLFPNERKRPERRNPDVG